MNFRDRSRRFLKSAGVAGGNKCQFCQRKIAMGAVDEHTCYRTSVAISLDRAKLKRIDELADKAGMNRSEFMTYAALAIGEVSPDEQKLLEIVRGMRR